MCDSVAQNALANQHDLNLARDVASRFVSFSWRILDLPATANGRSEQKLCN
jgi:hypothetical protein